jgi:hypothetical protein
VFLIRLKNTEMKGVQICFLMVYLLVFTNGFAQQTNYLPGQVWKDTNGKFINAHGGGIMLYNGIYYWYGEIKSGRTWRVPYVTSWEAYRVNAGGVNCYSSKDLLNWKYEGVALAPNTTDSSHDLHTSKVIERPKVIYNKKTKQFVMWMHLDNEDYSYAHAGVAVSDKPIGPFRFVNSVKPNGNDSRDMTLFQDDDGKAYHFYSSEGNATLHVTLLTDDYLRHTSTEKRILIGASREAPAVVKYNSNYFLFTSGCTGWAPNPAMYATAAHPLGEWKMMDNPCVGEKSETTFDAQSTFIIKVPGKSNAFIFLSDRWNKSDLPDSRYVWLPMTINNERPVINWADKWNNNYFR